MLLSVYDYFWGLGQSEVRNLTRSLLVKVWVKLNSNSSNDPESVLNIPRLRLFGLSAMMIPVTRWRCLGGSVQSGPGRGGKRKHFGIFVGVEANGADKDFEGQPQAALHSNFGGQ